ncbi:MAG TPA: hypothetical protein VFE96_06490 [Candidatus Bathyarchaeia archaeon]|nr:hypothetical protein [Candidatus Bathyarchaeia archaeon]
MVFGVFIDVPLIVGGFFIMFRFRNRLARSILKVKLPTLALYLALSVPLIIFEEQIDCMPAWCGAVIIPPTLPFLFIEMFVLGGVVLWKHARNVPRVTLVFSVYGVLFEIFLGGLVGAPPIIIMLLAPYVAVGYAFISLLPLTVLVNGEAGKVVGPTGPPQAVSSV